MTDLAKDRIMEAVKALPPGAVVIGNDGAGLWTVTALTPEAYEAVTAAMSVNSSEPDALIADDTWSWS